MKKEYIEPSIKAIKIKAFQMVMSSLPVGEDGSANSAESLDIEFDEE